MSFLWFIIVGIVAGWAAGKVIKGGGFGLIVNFLIGIVGSLLGGWLFSLIGLHSTGGIIALDYFFVSEKTQSEVNVLFV